MVLVELIALFGGLFVINGVLDAPEVGLARTALVVGVHFIGLAVVWKAPVFQWLGAAIAICGAVGLALAVGDASGATIAVVSGIIPGALLIGSSYWAVLSDSTVGSSVTP